MSYIGASPIVGNFQVCDAISVVNGQAAYTMQVGSANVFPESANHMLVSLNGILQKPNGSFTISGSTITFSSNLVTGDVIDFIQLLGDVLDIGTPSDATVTNAKTNFTSTSSAAGLQIKGDGTTDGTLQLNCSQNSHGIKLASPAHSAGQSYTVKFPTGNITADKFLKVASISGSGTSAVGQLSFADAGGGAWNLISTTTISNDATVLVEGLNSTYAVYAFTIHDLVPVSSPVVLQLRYKIGGSVITDGKYDYVSQRANGAPNDTLSTGGTGNDTQEISLTYDAQVSNGAAKSFASTIFLYNPSGTAKRKMIRHISVFHSAAGGITQVDGCGAYNNSNDAVTGLQFYVSSGNLNTGVIKLYGIS